MDNHNNLILSQFRLILFLLCACVTFNSMASSKTLNLMPYPHLLVINEGHLQLANTISIKFDGFSEQRKTFYLARLEKQFSRIAKQNITFQQVDNANQADIYVVVEKVEKKLSVPTFDMDEGYQLAVNKMGVVINAKHVFGAQHGLTTLVQLLNTNGRAFQLPLLTINDAPRFAWRGLLIDSVRHFMPLSTIKRQLDGMAAAKLNVLHWHLTDDQGWRIESKLFPKLTALASDGLFYSQTEVREVIDYASQLGIRVVPEFGMPGHASAIAVAYPELMSKQLDYDMERHWGVFKPLLNVANPEVYQFVDKLIMEMTGLFPDHYLHIGGDEVEPKHWLENNDIQRLMKEKGLRNGADIQNYFNQQIEPIITKYNRTMMGWDEIFHPNLPKGIVVQSWRGHDSLNHIANAGYKGILSTGFYIDQPQYSDYHYRNDPLKEVVTVDSNQPMHFAKSFEIERLKGANLTGELLVFDGYALIKLNRNHFQKAELRYINTEKDNTLVAYLDSWMGPLQFEFDVNSNAGVVIIGNSPYPLTVKPLEDTSAITFTTALTDKSKQNIVGAEATIWSELVTEANLDLRIWPRLFAIAERLWSSPLLTNSAYMYQRLSHMSHYADNVIGLKHKQQQKAGLSAITKKSFAMAQQAAALQLLFVMAEMLEPSHYYTRHHIKYLNNQYHQMAPLTAYVDFLPVESQQLISLRRKVEQYKQGNKQALTAIEKQINDWHSALNTNNLLETISNEYAIQTKLDGLKDFLILSQAVINHCKGEKHYSKLDKQLIHLQPLTQEWVMAGIYPMRELYQTCQ